MGAFQLILGDLPKFYCFCTEQDFITAEFLQKSVVWQNQSYAVDSNKELIRSILMNECDLTTCPQ